MNVYVPQPAWRLPATGVAVAIAVAVGMVLNPLVVAAATVVLCGICLCYVAVARLQRLWLVVAGVLFCGLMLFDKSFAYIGYAPVYVSEIVLAFGLLTLALRGGLTVVFRSPVTWLWLALAADGVLRTVPYLGTYGIDAIRDAMLWGYGLYALLVACFLLQTDSVTKVPAAYFRFLPWFLVALPPLAMFATVFASHLPQFPHSTTLLLEYKAGDASVHLAGAAAFILLGLHEFGLSPGQRMMMRRREWLWWFLWLASVGIFAPTNRGGMMAIATAIGVVVVLRPQSSQKWVKQGLIAAVAFLLLVVTGVSVMVNQDSGRALSADQVIADVSSLVGGTSSGQAGYLADTRQWRLNWWNTIIGYTIKGPYFWTGKGYGVNLATDDGFQVASDGSLRAPHSVHFSFLARAGVPGLALWLGLLATFWWRLLRAYRIAQRNNQTWWARVNIWILAYTVALVVNASFDVAIEGPQQGVVFWALVGFGIAALIAQRRGVVAP